MKKILLLLTMLLIASCWQTPTEEIAEENTDPNPDITNIFTQVCKDKVSKCKQLACSKEEWVFNCNENPLAENKNCSEEKSYDKIVTKYKICSEDKDLLTWQIFNYSEKKNEFFETMTPEELEKKLAEETKKVEEGWESEWLWTFLASAWWALLWWIIADKLFWGWATQVPQAPQNNTENNRTVTKESLEQTKTQAREETKTRDEKRKEDLKKRVTEAKKKITPRKSSSKKKRR